MAGDRVVVDSVEAQVLRIGFRSTHLRTIYAGETLVMPNSQLAASPLLNRSLMTQRRVRASLHVGLEAPPCCLAFVPAIVEAAVREAPLAEFVYAHLMEIGPEVGYSFTYVFTIPTGERYVMCCCALRLCVLGHVCVSLCACVRVWVAWSTGWWQCHL